MAKYVITYIEPKLDLEGRLNSEIEACFWKINGKKLEKPFFSRIRVPFVVPTKPLSSKQLKALEKAVKRYKKFYQERYQGKSEELRNELRQIRKNSKAYQTKKLELEAISEFLKEIDERIKWEVIEKENNKKVVYLTTPFFSRLDFELYFSPFLPRFNERVSIKKIVSHQIGFPFSIIEENEEKEEKEGDKPSFNKFSLKGESASLELLVEQPGLALDFETQNWEEIELPLEYKEKSKEELEMILTELGKDKKETTMKRKDQLLRDIKKIYNQQRDERITIAAITNLKKGFNYLVTTLDFPAKYIEADNPRSEKKEQFEIIRVNDQYELIEKVNELFEKFQPFYVYGHNQMKFDYNKAEELTFRFGVGVEGRKPKRMAQIPNGYIQQVILPGRIDIDPAGYSQFYMSNVDNRLDSVFNAVTGKRVKKSLTHPQIIEKTILAEQGDINSAKELLFYAAQDAMKSYIIGEELKQEHVLLAKAFNSLPARIDTTSPKKLACDYHEQDYFKRKGYFRLNPVEREIIEINNKAAKLLDREEKVLSFQEFNLEELIEKLLIEASKRGYRYKISLSGRESNEKKERLIFKTMDIILHSPLKDFSYKDIDGANYIKNIVEFDEKKLRTRKGVYDCKLVVINPLVESFKEFIQHDKNLIALYEEAKRAPPLKRLRYFRALTALIEYPFFRTLDANKKSFEDDFNGVFVSRIDELKRNIYENIKYIGELFMNGKVINFARDLYLIEDDDISNYLLKRLEKRGLAFEIGKARALSGPKGVIIGTTQYFDFMKGFSPPHSNRGEKFPIEQEFYSDFLNELIWKRNERGALEVFKRYLKAFIEYDLPEEAFMIRKKVKRDFYEYSSGYKAEIKNQIRKKRAKKGDYIEYSYSKPVLYNKLFGYSKDKFAPQKGKLTRLICWAFEIDNSERGRKKQELLRDVIEKRKYDSLFDLIEED